MASKILFSPCPLPASSCAQLVCLLPPSVGGPSSEYSSISPSSASAHYTHCSFCPASLPGLIFLAKVYSFFWLQRAPSLRRSLSCPATPQGEASHSISHLIHSLLPSAYIHWAPYFAGKMKMKATWSCLGALTESSRFLGICVQLLRDARLSLEDLPPLMHPHSLHLPFFFFCILSFWPHHRVRNMGS